MATVKITDNLVDQMLNNFYDSFNEERRALPAYPAKWPEGVGDELYNAIFPLDKMDQITTLYPDWWMHDNINQLNAYYGAGFGQAKLSKARPRLPRSPNLKLPGFGTFVHDGYHVNIVVTDLDKVELPKFKAAVESYNKIVEQHEELNKRVNASMEDLRAFLDKHRTLQQAVEEFGPALMTWVPQHYKEQYERVAEPKKKAEEKKEEIIVDLDSLRTRAINDSLGLNGNKDSDAAMGLAKRSTRKVRHSPSLASAMADTNTTLPAWTTVSPPIVTPYQYTI